MIEHTKKETERLITSIVKEIDEIKSTLGDLRLKLLKLYIQQLESEEIDDELYEELDKLAKEAFKNPEKCLSADEAIRELLLYSFGSM